MSSVAVLSKPYWRWRRYRDRRINRSPRAVAKPWNSIVTVLIAVPGLVLIDQYTKHTLATPDWAWHARPDSIYAWKLLGLAICVPLLFFSLTRLTGILATAGVLGNLTSLIVNDQRVANPFVTQTGDTRIAFNVADILLFAAQASAVLLAAQLIVLLYTRRHTP